MHLLLQQFRLAVRTRTKAPGFTITTVLSLAIGIGATVAVYSVIDATLLRPLPVAEPENLYAVRIIAAGLAAGAIVTLATARLLTGFVHGIQPGDPVMLGSACVLVAGAGLLACYVPARRAARIDPVQALRSE